MGSAIVARHGGHALVWSGLCDCGQPATRRQSGDPCCDRCCESGRPSLDREREVRARTIDGESARTIAEALGISARSVVRIRARLGISQPVNLPRKPRTCWECKRKFHPRGPVQVLCGNECRLRHLWANRRRA